MELAKWLFKPLARLRSRGAARKTPRTQPAPEVSGKEVMRIVERDFPYDFTTVTALLSECGVNAFRVQLACLKLAAGDLQKLRRLTAAANRDCRDVLAHAEYPEYFRTASDKKLSDAERQRIYETDWNQYQHWLRR